MRAARTRGVADFHDLPKLLLSKLPSGPLLKRGGHEMAEEIGGIDRDDPNRKCGDRSRTPSW
jgi:hypothetical protein